MQQRENFSSANSSWNNLVTGSEVVNTQILKSSYVLEPVFRNIYQTIRQFRQTLICGGLYTMLSQAEALSQRSRDRSRIHLSTMINHSQSRFQSDLTRILEGALPRIQHHQNETSETLQLLKSKNEPLISDGIARLELIFSYSNRNLQMDYISQKVLRTIQPDIEQLRLIETRLLSNPSSLDVAMVNQLKQNLNCR